MGQDYGVPCKWKLSEFFFFFNLTQCWIYACNCIYCVLQCIWKDNRLYYQTCKYKREHSRAVSGSDTHRNIKVENKAEWRKKCRHFTRWELIATRPWSICYHPCKSGEPLLAAFTENAVRSQHPSSLGLYIYVVDIHTCWHTHKITLNRSFLVFYYF